VAVCGVGCDVREWGVVCGMWGGWVCVGWVEECDGCEGWCVGRMAVLREWLSVCDGLCEWVCVCDGVRVGWVCIGWYA
jgi:hypothetical protein